MSADYAALSRRVEAILAGERPEDREQAAYLIARYALLRIWHVSRGAATRRTRSILAEFTDAAPK